ncbi:hypothetical protein [Butyrivibrio fibrisolvens]|uniref:hypothetical protein n=1 Tax=Butyrivibrio fibrisolvens TaxID=831 RepID=UPI000424169E|nr:hypothetical protein [Butyrivibrio fibrisolvens]
MRKVVFLPCHPNMWEGFETLWDKEISSPNTIVKVIPIPTYDVDRNGTVIRTEYITTGYPDNVEICSVNDYNLEKERPDTIYIQNVQDGDDPVFAVHPHYHTGNLIKFTDDLEYIPYDCLREIDPEYSFLKRVYSKILTPSGIHNANRIIVHSENAKQVYVNLLAGSDISKREYWEQIVTCEGYPRNEILKKYTKETLSYPINWNRHLFNAFGVRKETVLFATSIFDVLEFNRSHIIETKKIMEDYLKKKDNTALIWRPHKYLPEAIMKLRPELFDDFRALLEFYITNDIGIFDETPTPTPAIILSDSYIGDECSVKELFKSTGKQILE